MPPVATATWGSESSEIRVEASAGSAHDGELEPFRNAAAVLLYVGRFLAVKRVPLLIRAYRRAQERFMRRAPL